MAKHNKHKKTLFFIASGAATAEEIEASAEFEPGVQFRNASLTRADEAIESFDRLGGLIPPRYQAVMDARAPKVAGDAPIEPGGAPAPAGEAQPLPQGQPAAPAPNPGAGWTGNA